MFSTTQLLSVFPHIDPDKVRDWKRRKLFDFGPPSGQGVESQYELGVAVKIAVLSFLSQMMPVSTALIPADRISMAVLADLERADPGLSYRYVVNAVTGMCYAATVARLIENEFGSEIEPVFVVNPWAFSKKIANFLKGTDDAQSE